MIVLIAALIGVIFGFMAARKRSGNRLDILQYCAGYGIAFTLAGVFITLLIENLTG